MKSQLIFAGLLALTGVASAQNVFNTGAGTNVGIGTTSPASPLEIVTGATDNGIKITQTTMGGAMIYLNNTTLNGRNWGMISTGSANNVGGGHFSIYDLTSSQNRFFISGTNGNIGLGTASPAQKLDVLGGIKFSGPLVSGSYAGTSGQILQSTGAGSAPVWVNPSSGVSGSGTGNYLSKWSSASALGNSQIFDNGSRIGIGTNSPASKLEVVDGTDAEILAFTTANTQAGVWALNMLNSYGFIVDGSGIGHIVNNINGPQFNLLNFRQNNSAAQAWIGTKPTTVHTDFSFAVGGKLVAQSVYVTLNCNWADYVFDKNYRLPKLSDVESYYTANKHLPEIPTAAEVEEKGIDVAGMNALLLKKVEELTMYVVEINKEVQNLKKENQDLKKQSK